MLNISFGKIDMNYKTMRVQQGGGTTHSTLHEMKVSPFRAGRKSDLHIGMEPNPFAIALTNISYKNVVNIYFEKSFIVQNVTPIMKTSLVVGIVVIVLIVVAAAGFLLYHSGSMATNTSSPTSMSSVMSTSTTSSSSTSVSTSTSTTTQTSTPTPQSTSKYSIMGLFSPVNATEATGVTNFYVLSYVEIQNLNTLMPNMGMGSAHSFQPSSQLSALKYFVNYSSPMYIEMLAHNTSYITVGALNYNTSGKGKYVAQELSAILGLYLSHSTSGQYKGLNYVYGYYETNGSLPYNVSTHQNVTVGVAYGFTDSGRAFFVVTYGLPNDSESAFNVLKIVSMRASGHIPSPPKEIVSTVFPRIEYGYVNASLMEQIASSHMYQNFTGMYNMSKYQFNMSYLGSLKYINVTSLSQAIYAQVTGNSLNSLQLVTIGVANTTNGTEVVHLINKISMMNGNYTVYFNGTKDGARILVLYSANDNLTVGIAAYQNYGITTAYYSTVDQGAYILSIIEQEINLLS